MQLRVRLFPNTNAFPGMKKADVNRFDDTVVQATIALEDISVPLWNTQIANRPQSHIQREQARGRAAVEWTRRAILNASGLLVVKPRYEKMDRLVHCRLVLLDEAGRSGRSWGAAGEERICGREIVFGLGAAEALNSFQLSAIRKNGSQQSAVRSRKRRESEFPPTEESGLQTPPTKKYNRYKESGL